MSVALALLLGATGACTADVDQSPGGTADDAAMGLRPPDGDSGCGEAASTDPADLRPNRAVARCSPGSPAAEPLDEPVTLQVAVHEPGEDLAPLLLAEELGELAEENISIELAEADSLAEAYAALADGEVDVVAGDLHGAFLDMVVQGDGARLVLGGAVSSAAGDAGVDQAGLWIATGALSQPSRWMDVEYQPLAVSDGISGASAYPLMNTLLQGEVSLNDMDLVLAGGVQAAEKLLAGEVVAAWLEDPFWQLVAVSPHFELAATRPPEAIGGVALHERLLDADADREVGLAFVRAVIRTINTYLPEGYRDDDEVVAALGETTGWTEQQAQAGPPLVFDWEIRAGTIERMQQAMLPLGAVIFEALQPEDTFLDRSLYQEVVGAPR